jgi:hypothetical protein
VFDAAKMKSGEALDGRFSGIGSNWLFLVLGMKGRDGACLNILLLLFTETDLLQGAVKLQNGLCRQYAQKQKNEKNTKRAHLFDNSGRRSCCKRSKFREGRFTS